MNRSYRLIFFLAACVLAAAPALGADGNIGIFADAAGTIEVTDIPCGQSATLWVYALLEGASAGGITGVEYSIEVSGAGGLTMIELFEPSDIRLGTALGGGVNVVWNGCQTGDGTKILLETILVLNQGCVSGETTLQVVGHTTPSNPFFLCPLFTLCDAPVFTKVCLGDDITMCQTPIPPYPNSSYCSTSGSISINPGPTFTPVAVCDLKGDADANCVVDTPPSGDTVSVEGIVLAWKEFGARGPGAILDPVSKCCISVFDITDAPDIPTGHLVRVDGWVGNFAGLLEIIDNPANGAEDPIVTDLGFYQVVTPFEVAAGMLADFSPFAELEESCLLSVCGTFQTTDTVFGANVNYTFLGTDGKSIQVRIDGDTNSVGQPIPTEVTLVSGVLGQFNSFTDTCIGYQLLPRSIADIEEGKCKPVTTESKTWGSIKSQFGNE